MKNYYTLVKSEKERIFGLKKESSANMNFFLLTSANLHSVMPHIPLSSHDNMIRNMLLHQSLSLIEQSCIPVIEKCCVSGSDVIMRSIPAIFCSFHLSSYRLNLSYLLNRKIPISLVASDNVIREQKEDIMDTYYKITGKRDFVIINSESAASLLQMTRELKKGKSLFIYIDGNSGVGGVRKDHDGLMKIKLFDKSIFVRKGVAFLSHFANVPIVPMLSYRTGIDDIFIEIFDSIEPSGEDRTVYCAETTTWLYDNFSKWLLKYPDQWEAWFYLHKYLDIRSISDLYAVQEFSEILREQKFFFDSDRFGFFFVKKEIFLFDKFSYRSYPIDSNTYNLLKNSVHG